MAFIIFSHCRGRRVVENCFGLLAARWRVLLKRIDSSVETADAIVKACCCLHNFLLDMRSPPPTLVDHGYANEKMVVGENLEKCSRSQILDARKPTVLQMKLIRSEKR